MTNGGRPRTASDCFHRDLSAASAPQKRRSLLSQPNHGNDDHKTFVRRTISKARFAPKTLQFSPWKPWPAERSIPGQQAPPPPETSLTLDRTLSEMTYSWGITSTATSYDWLGTGGSGEGVSTFYHLLSTLSPPDWLSAKAASCVRHLTFH